MKPYRLKHHPTGLYYQPNSGLSKKGKIYQTESNALKYFTGHTVTISIDVNKKQFALYKDYFHRLKSEFSDVLQHRINTYLIPKQHFIKEEL